VFLFRTALAILKTYEPELIKSTLEECVPMLRRLPEDIDEQMLFTAIQSITVPDYVNQFISRILKSKKKRKRRSTKKKSDAAGKKKEDSQ